MEHFFDDVDSAQIHRRRKMDFDDGGLFGLHADNVTANAGSGGATFATDDIAGIQWPFVKAAWGPRDTANEVDRAPGKGLPIQGEAIQGATATGAPVMVGCLGSTADQTAVSNGQVTRPIADTLGKQIVLQGAIHDMQIDATVNYTSTSPALLVAAAGAGIRFAVTSVMVTNGSTSVATKVEIRDGTTAKIKGYAAASGGGFALSAGGRPLFITTANSTLAACCLTPSADVDVSIGGYKITN